MALDSDQSDALVELISQLDIAESILGKRNVPGRISGYYKSPEKFSNKASIIWSPLKPCSDFSKINAS